MAFPGPLDPVVLGQSIMGVFQAVKSSIQGTITQVATFFGNFVASNIYAIVFVIIMVIIAFAELFIYTSLAITTNCLIYGDCHLSAMLVLFAPIIVILVNMFELSGFKTHPDIVNKFQRLKDMKDPSFLSKTNQEKKEHIQRILKRSN